MPHVEEQQTPTAIETAGDQNAAKWNSDGE
jgi:hypothetical protein